MLNEWELGLAILMKNDWDKFFSLYAKGMFTVSQGSDNPDFCEKILNLSREKIEEVANGKKEH